MITHADRAVGCHATHPSKRYALEVCVHYRDSIWHARSDGAKYKRHFVGMPFAHGELPCAIAKSRYRLPWRKFAPAGRRARKAAYSISLEKRLVVLCHADAVRTGAGTPTSTGMGS